MHFIQYVCDRCGWKEVADGIDIPKYWSIVFLERDKNMHCDDGKRFELCMKCGRDNRKFIQQNHPLKENP